MSSPVGMERGDDEEHAAEGDQDLDDRQHGRVVQQSPCPAEHHIQQDEKGPAPGQMARIRAASKPSTTGTPAMTVGFLHCFHSITLPK